MDDVTAVIDQPTDDLRLDDQQIDPQPTETKPDDTQPEDRIDGRKGINPEWSRALKELREQFPDRADMLTKLRDTYGRYQALNELAPKGIEDVRAWKTTIDAVGGPEAAAEMMQRVASMEQVDSRIEAGDFSVVGDLPENLQKGFYQMLPDALTHMQESDPAAYSAAVKPHFSAALSATGMGKHLEDMYAAADDPAKVRELIKQQHAWYQQQTQGAGAMPTGQKSVDPQVQRLQTELETRRKADDDAFIGGITQSTNAYVADAFKSNAEVYLKQFNLTEAQQADLMESFGAKLTAKLGADASFQKQLGAYKTLKNRSAETVNTYIRSKVDENAKAIIDGLVTARYGGQRVRKPAAPSSTTTTDNGATRITNTPDRSEWDEAKMQAAGYEATAKVGKFFLKGGRTVQVVKQ